MRVPHGLARLARLSGFQVGTIANRPKRLQEHGPVMLEAQVRRTMSGRFVIGHFTFVICCFREGQNSRPQSEEVWVILPLTAVGYRFK